MSAWYHLVSLSALPNDHLCLEGDACADMTAGLNMYTTGAGIIIAMSFLTVCVAVLGCCGAHKQSRKVLKF